MSYEELIKSLRSNAESAYQRRVKAQQSLLDTSVQAQYAAAAQSPGVPGGVSGRPGGGKNKGLGPNGPGIKGLVSPLEGYTITSQFGGRTHPITGRHSSHTGIDLAAPEGTPIRAVQTGRVRTAKSGDSIYGNQIILGHGRGFQTMYGHLSKLAVKPGQRVRKGDIIGYVGSTGLSTGPHLHWETWRRGTPFNPAKFL